MLSPSTIWIRKPISYPNIVGQDLFNAPFLQAYLSPNSQVFILSDEGIPNEYLNNLTKACIDAGVKPQNFILPQGEVNKTLESANKIWIALLEQGCTRDSTLITLGGGMVGDLGGFVASCYHRGMNLIHVPTTLLAQVDAAIGGKTGVNLPHAKNLIGTFYPPKLILSDIDTLKTLPQREFNAGLAELIKYGLTLDFDFFEWLESNLNNILAQNPTTLIQAIEWAVKLKASIVNLDDNEQNQRVVLNFGHTVAHAIESLSDYQAWLHGEAVGMGMLVALQLSIQRHPHLFNLFERTMHLLKSAHLPTRLPNIPVADILLKIQYDKKRHQQTMRWVILREKGEAYVDSQFSSEDIISAVKRCQDPQ